MDRSSFNELLTRGWIRVFKQTGPEREGGQWSRDSMPIVHLDQGEGCLGGDHQGKNPMVRHSLKLEWKKVN